MRFRAHHKLSPRAAAFAGVLMMAALPRPALAEETNPCFTGNGTVKEVLDACAAFIASGSTDEDRLNTAHRVRAMALSATGDLDAAIVDLDAAIKVEASEPNSYFMRAAAYDAKKDFDKAITDLDEAIRLDGKRGDFYMLRGIVYDHKGDLDRALVELNEKVKLDPESSEGYAKRADLYRQRKEYDPAVADYSEV
ncbi:MAG TPA: tetratricopeptide repeat protein, partial [Methyloceanibacter sp.]|nr:tetratricopeptide repeat protein [Methyloceanibacter sp.]